MKKEELENIIEIVKKKNEQELIHIILTLIDGSIVELYCGEEFQFEKRADLTISFSYNDIKTISSGIIVSYETITKFKNTSANYRYKGYNSKYIPLSSILNIEFKKLLLANITVEGFNLTSERPIRDGNYKT